MFNLRVSIYLSGLSFIVFMMFSDFFAVFVHNNQLRISWNKVTIPMKSIKNKESFLNFDCGIRAKIFFPIKEPNKPITSK